MTVESYPSELTVEEFKAVLSDPEISWPMDLLVLETLYFFEGHQGLLKEVIDFHDNPSLRSFNNMQFVKRIGTKYDIHLEERRKQKYKYWNVLFNGERVKKGYKWKLKPELIQAMEELGLTGETLLKKNTLFPDEIPSNKVRQFPEGGMKTIVVNAYERNQDARIECLREWKTVCVVCGFDFEKVYGDLGKGFIHVHHLKPLSEIGETYEIDPINDLRPVCPNCHAMLHRSDPVLTIEKLIEKIEMVKTETEQP